MSKLTKQDIQDIADGCTVKYVSNSFTKDELIIELAQLCLKAIDEKEDILYAIECILTSETIEPEIRIEKALARIR